MSKIRPSGKELLSEMTPSTKHADELVNITPITLSLERNDYLTEEDKVRLVCSRFWDIKEDDLMEGDKFSLK